MPLEEGVLLHVFIVVTHRLFDVLTLLDGVALSPSSEWNPVRFSKQWPEFFEGGLALILEVVEGSTYEDGGIAPSIVCLGHSCMNGCVHFKYDISAACV